MRPGKSPRLSETHFTSDPPRSANPSTLDETAGDHRARFLAALPGIDCHADNRRPAERPSMAIALRRRGVLAGNVRAGPGRVAFRRDQTRDGVLRLRGDPDGDITVTACWIRWIC